MLGDQSEQNHSATRTAGETLGVKRDLNELHRLSPRSGLFSANPTKERQMQRSGDVIEAWPALVEGALRSGADLGSESHRKFRITGCGERTGHVTQPTSALKATRAHAVWLVLGCGRDAHFFIRSQVKRNRTALAGVARWLEHRPVNRRVPGSVPCHLLFLPSAL